MYLLKIIPNLQFILSGCEYFVTIIKIKPKHKITKRT